MAKLCVYVYVGGGGGVDGVTKDMLFHLTYMFWYS